MALGRLMLDLKGTEVTAEEAQLLASPVVGGLILFSRNFESVEQLSLLVKSIRQASPDVLIAVDHEGGRVQRFRNGFTRLPAMALLGKLYCEDKSKALDVARDIGWLMAAELRCVDIDFTFAPVLDVDIGISKVIGDRSFSSNPEVVAYLGEALIAGMAEAGMASTGKHFPGHGAVEADSHVDIPRDQRSFDEIQAQDLEPFNYLAARGMNAVMPAHVIYTEVDPSPAGFSRFWLQDVLKQRMAFDGIIFSDDLSMEGATVAGSFTSRAEVALSAGCDMVLVCNNPEAALEVADWLSQQDDYATLRLELMRGGDWHLTLEELKADPRWLRCQTLISELNSL